MTRNVGGLTEQVLLAFYVSNFQLTGLILFQNGRISLDVFFNLVLKVHLSHPQIRRSNFTAFSPPIRHGLKMNYPVPVVGCEASFFGDGRASLWGSTRRPATLKTACLAKKFHQLHELQRARQDF